VVYAVSPVTSGVHLLVVPHFFCSEHGELEHFVDSEGCDGHDHHGHSSPEQASFANIEPSELSPHAHIICHSVELTQREALETSELEHVAAFTVLLDKRRTPATQSHGLSSLFLAPKNSPPTLL
jgi:hypothetical protein